VGCRLQAVPHKKARDWAAITAAGMPSWRRHWHTCTCTCTHPTVQSVLVWVLAGVSKVWLAIYSIEAAESSGRAAQMARNMWPALGQNCHAHCEEGLRLLLGVVKG
jgi:hypothetical protein